MCGNPVLIKKSVSTIFHTALADFVSPCQSGNARNISHLMIIICYGDLRCYSCGCLQAPQITPMKAANWTAGCCVFWLLSWVCPPIALLLLGPPYFLRCNSIESRPVSNPTMDSQCFSERRSCPSLSLNQELEVSTVIEEGISGAETGWKLGL